MGCGWGLSSEVLAYCGLDVTAVDINPNFVALTNTRARNNNLRIIAHEASFDEFTAPEQSFDLIFFYECFHHATRPWELLTKMATLLNAQGQIFIASEPVQSIWWKTWGLRLDPLSIYCIRKFGWFESGWSENFLRAMFCRAGLFLFPVANPSVTDSLTFRGTKQSSFSTKDLTPFASPDDWYFDGPYLVSKGSSSLKISVPPQYRRMKVDLSYFRPRGALLEVVLNEEISGPYKLSTGSNSIFIDLPAQTNHIQFESETWVPSQEIGNTDSRNLAFHLEQISFH